MADRHEWRVEACIANPDERHANEGTELVALLDGESAGAQSRPNAASSSALGMPESDGAGLAHGSSSAEPLRYRAEIDGLRAVAVVPVVLFHFEVPPFTGGFCGVDVFFVISGYLITSIIMRELSDGTFTFRRFWIRRCRRLFPAFAFMLASLLIAANFTLPTQTYASLARQAVSALLLVANVHYFYSDDYWTAVLERPLLHCWTLAVEEQFYILAPTLYWVIWTACYREKSARSSKSILLAIAAVFLASLAVSLWRTTTHPKFAFYLLPARAWELALGGLVSLIRPNEALSTHFPCPSGRSAIVDTQSTCSINPSALNACKIAVAELASWAGLAMLAYSYLSFHAGMPYPGYHALLPCCGTTLFVLSQSESQTSCARLLATQWPVLLGRLSYSLYLWHWPIYVLLASSQVDNKLDNWQTTVGIGASLVSGYVSYTYVEPVFRQSGPAHPQKPHDVNKASCVHSGRCCMAFVLGAWAMLLLAAGSLAISGVGGIKGKLVAIGSEHLSDDILDIPPCTFIFDHDTGQDCMIFKNEMEIDSWYSVNASQILDANVLASKDWEDTAELFEFNSPPAASVGPKIVNPAAALYPSIALIGNSHCLMYGHLVQRLAHTYNVSVGILCNEGGWYGKFFEPLSAWDMQRIQILKEWRVHTIVWAEKWAGAPLGNLDGYNFGYAFKLLLSLTDRLLVLGDVPTIPISPDRTGNDILKLAVHLMLSQDPSKQSLLTMREEPSFRSHRLGIEKQIRLAIEADPSGEFHAELAKADCMDAAQYALDCEQWKLAGQCAETNNFMVMNCHKTCGFFCPYAPAKMASSAGAGQCAVADLMALLNAQNVQEQAVAMAASLKRLWLSNARCGLCLAACSNAADKRRCAMACTGGGERDSSSRNGAPMGPGAFRCSSPARKSQTRGCLARFGFRRCAACKRFLARPH